MPKIRSLTRIAEIPGLTTFQDDQGPHATNKQPQVSTDLSTGEPLSVTVDGVSLGKISDDGTIRSWVGTVDAKTWHINTFGSYPSMGANLATN